MLFKFNSIKSTQCMLVMLFWLTLNRVVQLMLVVLGRWIIFSYVLLYYVVLGANGLAELNILVLISTVSGKQFTLHDSRRYVCNVKSKLSTYGRALNLIELVAICSVLLTLNLTSFELEVSDVTPVHCSLLLLGDEIVNEKLDDCQRISKFSATFS